MAAAQSQAVNVSVAVEPVGAGAAVPTVVSFDLPPQVSVAGFQFDVVSANATTVLFQDLECGVCDEMSFVVSSGENSSTVLGVSYSTYTD